MSWKKICFISIFTLMSVSCQKHENIKVNKSRLSDLKSPVVSSELKKEEKEDLESADLAVEENFVPMEKIDVSNLKQLYKEMKLESSLSYEIFEQAVKGMNEVEKRKKNLLTIVDFARSANEERMFILDLQAKKLLFKSLVSHGKGSGQVYATTFSNKGGTNKSSDGFFLTGGTYSGKNGLSLRLHGLEQGRNHSAYARTLVIHGADYVSESYIKSNGRLGRSKGCFAVPRSNNKKIIELIANRTVFYVHSKGLHYKDFSF